VEAFVELLFDGGVCLGRPSASVGAVIEIAVLYRCGAAAAIGAPVLKVQSPKRGPPFIAKTTTVTPRTTAATPMIQRDNDLTSGNSRDPPRDRRSSGGGRHSRSAGSGVWPLGDVAIPISRS